MSKQTPSTTARRWRVLALAIGGLSTPLSAQEFATQQLQPLLQQGQRLAGCLARIDQATLTSLRAQGEAVAARVEALCHDHQQAAARAAALAFGRQMMSSAVASELRECAPALALVEPALAAFANGADDTVDVCAAQSP